MSPLMKRLTYKIAIGIVFGAACATATTALAACWAHTHHLYYNDDPSTAVLCSGGTIIGSDCEKVDYSPDSTDTVECYDDGNEDTGFKCDSGTKTISKTVSTGTATCSGCVDFVAGDPQDFDVPADGVLPCDE